MLPNEPTASDLNHENEYIVWEHSLDISAARTKVMYERGRLTPARCARYSFEALKNVSSRDFEHCPVQKDPHLDARPRPSAV